MKKIIAFDNGISVESSLCTVDFIAVTFYDRNDNCSPLELGRVEITHNNAYKLINEAKNINEDNENFVELEMTDNIRIRLYQ